MPVIAGGPSPQLAFLRKGSAATVWHFCIVSVLFFSGSTERPQKRSGPPESQALYKLVVIDSPCPEEITIQADES